MPKGINLPLVREPKLERIHRLNGPSAEPLAPGEVSFAVRVRVPAELAAAVQRMGAKERGRALVAWIQGVQGEQEKSR